MHIFWHFKRNCEYQDQLRPAGLFLLTLARILQFLAPGGM